MGLCRAQHVNSTPIKYNRVSHNRCIAQCHLNIEPIKLQVCEEAGGQGMVEGYTLWTYTQKV